MEPTTAVAPPAGKRMERSRSVAVSGRHIAVRWPGQVPAGRIDGTSVISAVDMLPTFSAIAGVSLPEGYQPDGENVLPALLWGRNSNAISQSFGRPTSPAMTMPGRSLP